MDGIDLHDGSLFSETKRPWCTSGETGNLTFSNNTKTVLHVSRTVLKDCQQRECQDQMRKKTASAMTIALRRIGVHALME